MNSVQPQKAKKSNSRRNRAHARQKSTSSTTSTTNGPFSDLAAVRTSSTPTPASAESRSPRDLVPKTVGDKLIQNGPPPATLIDPALLASPMAGLSAFDARWAGVIYQAGFDTIFGSWMSRYGCPFLYVALL